MNRLLSIPEKGLILCNPNANEHLKKLFSDFKLPVLAILPSFHPLDGQQKY
jgi:hypothetical protein